MKYLYLQNTITALKRFVDTEVSREQMSIVVEIIYGCHSHHSENKAFVAICAPSYIGKTQMSISLDDYSEYPQFKLEGRKDAVFKVVLRIVASSVVANWMKVGEQEINHTPFDVALYEAIETDFNTFHKSWKSENFAQELSCSQMSYYYQACDSPSYLLGFLAAWIQARIDRRDHVNVNQTGPHSVPLSYNAMRCSEYFTPSVSPEKPIAIVLDEFQLYGSSDPRTLKSVFLRNFLRIFGFCVTAMGTNSKLSNMKSPPALGGGSGLQEKSPWAHVLTNLFTPNLSKGEIKDYFRSLSENPWFIPFIDWISSDCCFRAGVLGLFMREFKNSDKEAFPERLLGALNTSYDILYDRKKTRKTLNWLIGQVAVIFSKFRANPSHDAKNEGDRLLSDHYAYIKTYSDNERIHFFTLERKAIATIKVVPWSIHDDLATVSYTNEYCDPISFPEYLKYAKTTCAVAIRNKDNIFYTSSCYPKFNLDELTYLLLTSANPFTISHSDLIGDNGHLELEDLKSIFITDPKDIQSSEYTLHLTSRAAVTIYFRDWRGIDSATCNSSQAAPRPGELLELVSLTSIVIASHAGGLSGAKFMDFLASFIGELSFVRRDISFTESSFKIIQPLDRYIIPYIPLIGGTCSKLFNCLPGVNIGVIRHTRDLYKVDGLGFTSALIHSGCPDVAENDVFYTLECKCFDEKADYGDLGPSFDKAISARRLVMQSEEWVKGRSPIVHFHFFVASRMAEVKSESWQNFREKHPRTRVLLVLECSLDGSVIVRTPTGFDGISFEKEKLIPDEVDTCLVVFSVETLFPKDPEIIFSALIPNQRVYRLADITYSITLASI